MWAIRSISQIAINSICLISVLNSSPISVIFLIIIPMGFPQFGKVWRKFLTLEKYFSFFCLCHWNRNREPWRCDCRRSRVGLLHCRSNYGAFWQIKALSAQVVSCCVGEMQKLLRQCITDNSQICLAIMQIRAFISHLLSSSPVWNSHLWHLVSLFLRQFMFKYSHGHNIVKCLVVFIRERQVGHFWNDCNPRQVEQSR